MFARIRGPRGPINPLGYTTFFFCASVCVFVEALVIVCLFAWYVYVIDFGMFARIPIDLSRSFVRSPPFVRWTFPHSLTPTIHNFRSNLISVSVLCLLVATTLLVHAMFHSFGRLFAKSLVCARVRLLSRLCFTLAVTVLNGISRLNQRLNNLSVIYFIFARYRQLNGEVRKEWKEI